MKLTNTPATQNLVTPARLSPLTDQLKRFAFPIIIFKTHRGS